VDLSDADLSGANLSDAHLKGVFLERADLSDANLHGATLDEAALPEAYLGRADLHDAHLRWVNLMNADLSGANLSGAHLGAGTAPHRADVRTADSGGSFAGRKADLSGAGQCNVDLRDADLSGADLSGATLIDVDLSGTNLSGADLTGATLIDVDLSGTLCIRTTFTDATLIGCNVYGISAWDVTLNGTKQAALRINPPGESSALAVDSLEVAQFLYLLLHNETIRHVFDTVTSTVVLILARFTSERTAMLDALREALRAHGYMPVLFDCASTASTDTTETVTLLARMARFVLADLTDSASIPYELATIVPDAHVPVQPLLLDRTTTFAMAGDHWLAREMLPVIHYPTPEALLATLQEHVIVPAEAKVAEIQRERATSLLRSGLPHRPLQSS
jgi:uncharacterized protein YjbI with pentapeptide repeats